MRGKYVDEDSRLVQVFLSQTQSPGPNIHEVSVKEKEFVIKFGKIEVF